MYVNSSSDVERTLAVEKVIEDIPGGGTVEPDDFKSDTTYMKEGALLGKDSNGIYRLFKTAELHANATDAATTYQVKKGHDFKVGDYIADSALTATFPITEIDTTNADYDVLTVGTTLGVALTAGDILVNAANDGSDFAYPVVGIATNAVDLSSDVANKGCGILVRGRVRESLLPYPVDSTVKALLPLIRFV